MILRNEQTLGPSGWILQKFRIFRVSTNRGSFGHRSYFVMNEQGIAFKTQRIYDLPLNGEIQVPKDPEHEIWDLGALGFECSERLTPNAPAKVVKQVFALPAIPADVLTCVMA